MYCLVRGGALVWRFWVSEGFWPPAEVFSKGGNGGCGLVRRGHWPRLGPCLFVMNKPLLRVSEVACARGGLTVLEGISFDVHAGTALILRGPNGSGKTTLLRTLAGLQTAVAGEVSVADETIAYAGHADGLKGTLTVAENLSFWASLFGFGAITPALGAFELSGLADRAAQSLSAGQKRRLGLARMLVTGRPVWLLDEPTVSLDVSAVALFGEAVKRHLAGGGVAVIATHIDLGIEAEVLDLSAFRAVAPRGGAFDEAFI